MGSHLSFSAVCTKGGICSYSGHSLGFLELAFLRFGRSVAVNGRACAGLVVIRADNPVSPTNDWTTRAL